MAKFRKYLASYGFKCLKMGADGNCLFRALANQLCGQEELHGKYRKDTVEELKSNKDEYSLFIEDDRTIEEYLEDMAEDGAWGSQLEIRALSAVYRFNCIIHQVDNPSMSL